LVISKGTWEKLCRKGRCITEIEAGRLYAADKGPRELLLGDPRGDLLYDVE
jgi:hypothetical protein